MSDEEKTETTEQPIDPQVRITELESRLAEREQKIAALETTVAAANTDLANTRAILGLAVAGYKTLVTQANTEVLPELVTGDSIEAVNQSLQSAKELVSKVKKTIATEAAATRIPAGAPQRTKPDLSILSAREKIHYALGK